jgi:hypothetical protein
VERGPAEKPTSIQRSPSKPEQAKVDPSSRSEPPRGRKPTGGKGGPAVAAEAEPEPEKVPRRRSSGSALARRRAQSGSEMPEAPPPTRPVEVAHAQEPVSAPALARALARDDRRTLIRQWKQRAMIAGAVAGMLALGLVFRSPLWKALSHTAEDTSEILLSVHSNPKTRVSVRHPPEEGASAPVTELGDTPLNAVKGAHLQDTLILSNAEVGIWYEEEIRFGEPNKPKLYGKEFARGQLKLALIPKGLTGLSVWRGNQPVGHLPGPKIDLYEGLNRLEIRGELLKKPFSFEAQVKPGATIERTVDLSDCL